MRPNRLTLLAVAAAVGLTERPTAGQPPDKDVEFAIAGLRDGRDRLQRGAFRCKGTRRDVSDSHPAYLGPVEVYCAFDVQKGLLRFDRKDVHEGKYARAPDRSIHWTPNPQSPSATVRGPTEPPPTQVAPFDPLIVGLCTYSEFVSDYRYAEKMALLGDRSKWRHVAAVRTDGRVRLEFATEGDWTVVDLDERKGYAPVRCAVYYSPDRPTPTSIPNDLCEVGWAEVNSVWVPLSVAVKYDNRAGRMTSYQLEFSWDRVNDTVPDENFSVEGMGLPEGTAVVKVEPDRSYVVGRLGDKSPEHLAETSPPERASYRWAVTAVVALLCVAAVALVVARRLRPPSTPA